MSSLVSVIGLAEVVRRANELAVAEYRPLEIYTFVVFEYLVPVLLVSAGVRWMERRLRADERQHTGEKQGEAAAAAQTAALDFTAGVSDD